MKNKNDRINKQLDKVLSAKKLNKNFYSKQSPILSRIGQQVFIENEDKLQKLVK